jgi:hypothetical protein
VAAASLALGDSVLSEAIDQYGDWDEFQLTVPQDTLVNLVVGTDLPVSGGVHLALLAAASDSVIGRASAYAGWLPAHVVPPVGTGLLALRAGTYHVRVDAGSGPGAFRGPYSLWAYAISRGVENGPATLAIGDSITGVLDPAGDWDTYTFTGSAHDLLDLSFGVTGPAASQDIYAIVRPVDADTGHGLAGAVGITGRAAASSERFELPATGTYAIDVHGRYSGVNTLERGTYTVALHPYVVVNEHVDSVLPLGDSVVGEALDEPGDVDQFVIRASPGAQVQVMAVMWGVIVTTFRRTLFEQDPWVPFAGATFSSTPWEQYTGRFTMPASGVLHLRVYEERSGLLGTDSPFGITGPMVVGAWVLDSLPEGVPQAVAIGDTVSEEIAPVGDRDVYTFQGTAGDSLEVRLQSTFYGLYLRLTVLDPSGAAVATVISPGTETGLGSSTGVFHLAASGTYRICVVGPSEVGGWKWPYRFLIVKH